MKSSGYVDGHIHDPHRAFDLLGPLPKPARPGYAFDRIDASAVPGCSVPHWEPGRTHRPGDFHDRSRRRSFVTCSTSFLEGCRKSEPPPDLVRRSALGGTARAL